MTLPPAVPAFGSGDVAEAAIAAVVTPVIAPEYLAATPQDPEYHSEGDVWTHTRMVADAFVNRVAVAQDEPGRALAFWAACLHDVGKAATTRAVDGRLTSKGHSAKGETMVRRALWEADVPFDVREHVCRLVTAHQAPFFLIDRPAREVPLALARLSMRSSCRLLAAVAEADALGRRCVETTAQRKMAHNTALFYELAVEAGCLDGPRSFPSDHARVQWLETGRPPGASWEDTKTEVTIMCGLPGTGKDHWLAKNRPGLPVVSLDALRAELQVEPGDESGEGTVMQRAREDAREHMRAGRPFAWNATNLGADRRAKLIGFFRAYAARVHVVYCEASAAVIAARNEERGDAKVPRSVVSRMADGWVVPTPDEAHTVTYAVEGLDPAASTWPPRPSKEAPHVL